MTLIECPGCKREVDIDAVGIEKQPDGLDLIVRCPRCAIQFVVPRFAAAQQGLLVARHGLIKDRKGRTRRVELGGTDT
jgi:hypothetical protein